MSRTRFKRNTMSAREIRRMGEREATREKRQAAIEAFWQLTPEERQQRIADHDAVARIQRNGITIEDMYRAENDAYAKGVKAGKDGAVRTCFAAVCMTLHEMHGFGRDRCAKVLNDVYEKLTMALTSEEAIQEVYDTMGLEIHFSNDVTEDAVTAKEA